MPGREYSIGELAQLAGVSRRAIRFYVQSGSIPPPVGRGRGSRYTDEHRKEIARIRERQRGVTLVKWSKSGKVRGAPRPGEDFGPPVEIASRVQVAPGIVLELSKEVRVPTPARLRRLAALIRAELTGLPGWFNKEEDDE